MRYESEVPYTGDARKALEVGRDVFIRTGFEVTAIRNNAFEARGGGMLNTKEDAIRAVSEASVSAAAGRLLIDADLGGLRRMGWFLAIFLIGMVLFFEILFGCLFGFQKIWFVALLPFSPWPVLGPLIILWTRKRAQRALDTLLRNMATVAAER
ncbi:MAG: hypothetical protein JXR94_00255 [Candidatus Hydrogenedentes bacterium]|nr:hypothetical protein [Candidatus Hydrogenedentota bacterium]